MRKDKYLRIIVALQLFLIVERDNPYVYATKFLAECVQGLLLKRKQEQK